MARPFEAAQARSRALDRLAEPRDQVARKERRVGRDGRDPGTVRPLGARPLHAGQHAGERAGKALDHVGRDRQAEAGKARRIAVGVEHQRRHLRPCALDHMLENGPITELAQALVTATHAPCLPAREQHTDNIARMPPCNLPPLSRGWMDHPAAFGHAQAGCGRKLLQPRPVGGLLQHDLGAKGIAVLELEAIGAGKMARPETARRPAACLDIVEQAQALIDGGDQLGVGRVAEMLGPGAEPAVIGRCDQIQEAMLGRRGRDRGAAPPSARTGRARAGGSGSARRSGRRSAQSARRARPQAAPRCNPSCVSHSSGAGSPARRSTRPTCVQAARRSHSRLSPASGGEQHQIATLEEPDRGQCSHPVHRSTPDPSPLAAPGGQRCPCSIRVHRDRAIWG